MNVSNSIRSEQTGPSGILFTVDRDGRFLMTQAMLDQLPFAGVSGNQLMLLQDLLGMEAGPAVSTLLRDTLTVCEEGLTRRIVVRDREGRLLSLSLCRMAGIAPGRMICTLEECPFPDRVPLGSAQSVPAIGQLPSRAEAFQQAAGLVVDPEAIGDGFAIMLVGLNKPRNVEGPVAEQIWSRLTEKAAKRLQAMVGPRGLVARYSENAFVIINMQTLGPILPDMTAGAIVSSFDRPFEMDGMDFFVGVNVGAAAIGTGPVNIGHCFRCAELALEDARRSGLPVRECTMEMVDAANAKLRLERDLREAFEYDGFKLDLQPKIDMVDGRCHGFEALVRWHHPERGLVAPEKFIPVAEESGLIVPLTDWVLHEVCRLLKAERAAGRSPLPISINMPPSQLMHRELKDFMKVISAYDIPPSLIEFELTDAMSVGELSRGIAMMSGLRAAGVKISVEDFGTGYSSLSRLVRLPVSILKIDRSFVDGLPSDAGACEVVTAITRVAHALNLTVVAEGVENDIQARFLADHGVTVAQGYLFSRPLPPEEAFRLAESRAG
jgi:EAL domain-containing protein (putative c-di-GMP-specific phosphodiesterase class I)/GGDEF domain-containing protein